MDKNKLEQAIENSITQWTFYAENKSTKKTDYPPIAKASLLDDCYLCEYSKDIGGTKQLRERCNVCPYYKKYGFCCEEGKPAIAWLGNYFKPSDHDPKYALEFVEQLKTLIWEIRQTKAQLEAEPKPKLRHGDYAIDDGMPIIIAPSQLPAFPMTSYNSKGMACGVVRNGKHCTRNIKPIGNIFDDLQALAGEPLEEFEMELDHGTFSIAIEKGFIRFGHKYGSLAQFAYADTNEAEGIHRKLGRVIHTLKAKLKA